MSKPVRPIRIEGEVAYVTLTKGYEVMIDADDVPLIAAWNWMAQASTPRHVYAARSGNPGTIMMHRIILGVTSGHVDHIDGNTLDNRRANLRPCSHAENMMNRALDKRNKFGLPGVFQRRNRFRACIKTGGRTVHLGTYSTPAEASAAYIGASKIAFGKFARKNN